MADAREMTVNNELNENLFSYGTLQAEPVQVSTFGRRLEGAPDVLVGYRLTMIKMQRPAFVALSGADQHRNLQFTGLTSEFVEGTVLKVTNEELKKADSYEAGADYHRILVQLKSGLMAWVYLHRSDNPH